MRKIVFLLIVCITMFLISCPLPEDNPPPEKENYTQEYYMIEGTVSSIFTGEKLSGCKIKTGGAITHSDSDGTYKLQFEKNNNQDIICFSKTGFASSYKSLRYYSCTSIILNSYLLPVDTVDIIDPNPENGQGNIIATPDGASVHIPNIEGIEENLVVSLTNYSVGTDEILAVPGDFEGITSDGEEAVLISKGMITVDILGETSGNEYTFDDGTYGDLSFDIVIPETASNPDVPPGTPLVLWYFDEERGVWIEEDAPLMQYGAGYTATVNHFSTFNADFKMPERTCISGAIIDPNPESGAGYSIALSFEGFYREYYQNDATFTVINLPRGIPMTIFINKLSTGEVWQKDFTSSTDIECLDLGTFPGPDYVPEVRGLSYTKGEDSVAFTWTGEPGDDFSHVEISYKNENVSVSDTVTVPAGTYTATISGLQPDKYTFVVKAVYGDSTESIGIQIILSVNLFYSLTVINHAPEYGDIYIYFDGDWDGQLYTGPVTLPSDIEVYVEPRRFDDWMCNWFWDWDPAFDDYIREDEGCQAEVILVDDITLELTFYSMEY